MLNEIDVDTEFDSIEIQNIIMLYIEKLYNGKYQFYVQDQ